MNEKLLKIENLTVTFKTDEGTFKAVDDVSFHLEKGEIVGLVGESGCGKSVSALALLRLIPEPFGMIEKGKIFFKGRNLLELSFREMRKIRGRAISMIFQEPLSALSPLHRIGRQMVESLILHRKVKKKEAKKIAKNWLKKVGILDVEEKFSAYPYQLSGGMQQRIMIAMSLIFDPDLIIADEPTTALDVTIQAQIFELIREMRQNIATSILLITHDMGVIWEMCDRVIVMYASKIVEEGSLDDIFSKPSHPYTQGLLASIPKLSGQKEKLRAVSGSVPSPLNYPTGCYFRNRCKFAFDRCRKETPKFVSLTGKHKAACFLAEKLMEGE